MRTYGLKVRVLVRFLRRMRFERSNPLTFGS